MGFWKSLKGDQMGFEKFGLYFLLNYFNQLGTVKNHLQLAIKELLLAVQSSVDIMAESTNKSFLGNRVEVINSGIDQIKQLLNYSIDLVSPTEEKEAKTLDPEQGMRLKEHIVNSIVSAIDDEIENMRDTSTEKSKLKVEALYTVKQVLVTQKRKILTQPSASTHTHKSEKEIKKSHVA
jgi:hypothetical protein